MPAFSLNSNTVVAAGTVINTPALGGYGYLVDQGPNGPDFTNRGDITFTLATGQSGVVALQLATGAKIYWGGHTVDNEGHLTVTSSGDGTFLYADSPPSLVNAGVIIVTAAGAAEGVHTVLNLASYAANSPATLGNAGQIVVSGGAAATGFYLGGGGLLSNNGLISASATGAGAAAHGVLSPFAILLENNGQIVAADSDPNVQSVGVQFGGGLGATIINNHGTITGEIAIDNTNTNNLDGQRTSINNYGTINGRMILGAGDHGFATGAIANSGTINGDVDMGPGDDSFFGQNGVQTGLISGGLGNDTLWGGAASDALQGNQGNDVLHGGLGDDIVVGGKDNDLQTGDEGNDIVWGNLGDDTLDGGDGADQVRGGQGNDVVRGGAGDDFVSGDRGDDTVSGGTGADLFHGSQDAGLDRVLDFSLAEGDRVFLDPGTTYTVSQVGADTVISMGGANQMVLVGVQMSMLPPGWIFGA